MAAINLTTQCSKRSKTIKQILQNIGNHVSKGSWENIFASSPTYNNKNQKILLRFPASTEIGMDKWNSLGCIIQSSPIAFINVL